MTLAPGTTLGRYQILEPLGSGGMATVYKAYEPSLDRTVALKVIRPGLAEEEGFLARFRREAQAVAKLSHPNIVHVLTFDEVDGRYFLAMDYLEGGTLKDRLSALSAGTLLEPHETDSIITQVADALAYAHEQGIVHRDINDPDVAGRLPGESPADQSEYGRDRDHPRPQALSVGLTTWLSRWAPRSVTTGPSNRSAGVCGEESFEYCRWIYSSGEGHGFAAWRAPDAHRPRSQAPSDIAERPAPGGRTARARSSGSRRDGRGGAALAASIPAERQV